jgi:hypothetical protein
VLHQGTLDNMRLHFGVVASTGEVLDAWAARVSGRERVGALT